MNKVKLILIFIGAIILAFLPIILNIWLPIWSEYRWLYFTWYSIFFGLIIFYLIVRRLRKSEFKPELLSRPQLTTEQAKELGEHFCMTNPEIGDNVVWITGETITSQGATPDEIAYHVFQLHNLSKYCHFFINLNKPEKFTYIPTDLNNIMTNPHNRILDREYVLEVCNFLAQKPSKIQQRIFKRYDTETGQVKEEVIKQQTEEEAKEQEEEEKEEKEREI